MRPRTLKIVVALALLVFVACTVVDQFDDWDHAFQTGNETEYNLIVLALCVGVGVSLARFIFNFPLLKFVAHLVFNLSAYKPLPSGAPGSFFVVPIPLIPPVLALRI
jgi:hypothetical protein